MLPGRHNHPVQVVSHSSSRPPDHYRSTPKTRLLHKFQKEPHCPYVPDLTSRGDNRLLPMQGVPFPGTQGQYQIPRSQHQTREEGPSGPLVPTPRQDDILHGHSSMGQPSLQTSAVAPSPISETEPECLSQEGGCPISRSTISGLVGLTSLEQGNVLQGTPQTGVDHGRQSFRMGSPYPVIHGPGPVVQTGSYTQYKLAGAQGNPPSSSQVLPSDQEQSCARYDGQRRSKGTYQSTRGDQILVPHAGSTSSGHLGRIQPKIHQGRTHIGCGKPPGRFPQQEDNRSRRVDVRSSPVPGNLGSVRPASTGPFRLTRECPGAEILFSFPDAGGGGNGCSSQQVAQGPPVCVPPPSLDSGRRQETSAGRGRSDLVGTVLAKTPLVCRPGGLIGVPSVEDSGGSHLPLSGSVISPGPAVASTSRLALEREGLIRQHYSAGVIEVIQASRRPSTNRIYDATWKRFASWCTSRGVDPLTISIPTLLDFLLEGLNKGLSYNTIRRQVAALSTVLVCGDQVPLSQHPTIKIFLKGAVHRCPSVTHRYPSWDLTKVLKALTGAPFEPIKQCSLHLLSLKVSFLVAITSARRISELAALSVREDLCMFREDHVILRLDPSFIPKVNTSFHRAQDLILPNFCPNPSHRLEKLWHTLDVRRALHHYIKRTARIRRTEALFISFHSSTLGLKVSSSTIGRWIKACIAQAYRSQSLSVPSHLTAHSTRSAATSAAWSTQASLEEICRAATWESPNSFIRHYKIDKYAAAAASFGRRVLQQVVGSQQI